MAWEGRLWWLPTRVRFGKACTAVVARRWKRPGACGSKQENLGATGVEKLQGSMLKQPLLLTMKAILTVSRQATWSNDCAIWRADGLH